MNDIEMKHDGLLMLCKTPAETPHPPYGPAESNFLSANPQTEISYQRREYDAETRLHFYRARYQQPYFGRFVSRDPAGYADGSNLYQYSRSSPVLRVDPLGRQCTDIRCPGVFIQHKQVQVKDPVAGSGITATITTLLLKPYDEMIGAVQSAVDLGVAGYQHFDHQVFYYVVVFTCVSQGDARNPGAAVSPPFSFKCNPQGPGNNGTGGFTDTDLPSYAKSMAMCDKDASAAFNSYLAGLASFTTAPCPCPYLKDYFFDASFAPVNVARWTK